MADSEGDHPDHTMRGRVAGSRLWLWLLLDADRWAVTAALLALVFGTIVALGAVDPDPLRAAMATSDPVETLFQALVGAIITGVTLVVTINQLVLSQELGTLGDQRDRMAGAMAFRRDLEDTLDFAVSPPEPSAFLRAIIEGVRDRGDRLRDATADVADAPLRSRIADFVDDLTEHADAVTGRIEGTQFGTFEVVSAALDFEYSRKIYEARQLRHEYAEAVDDRAEAAFDDLIEVLEFFGPAREHIKTLYFQWELINLSRSILYAAVPALVVAVGALLFLDGGAVTGATAGIDNLVWIVGGAATIAVAPFFILLSHVLRIATVAKRTLAIGPFVLRESDRDETEPEWE